MRKFNIGDQVIAVAAAGGDTFHGYIGSLGTVVGQYDEQRLSADPNDSTVIAVLFNGRLVSIFYDPSALRLATPANLLALKLGAWT